ncbi:APC family permease [Natrinema thermotolerans]|uniref:APC family permease n=1 Tax=Natrinema thermotolerans TaxID=121872 RepID=A0AAF0P937_9EURY|nr:APC family permease [Natrinema thermotolerans]QCC59283.1 amino acid permease [Natrinema thermotolerans]WMT06251.1 APC family permease [Natrinema thermotolerans]
MSETTQSGLEKALGSKEMLILAFGAMIGWGWIILAGDWINDGGPLGAIVAFLGGAVVVGIVAIIYSELAAAMPLVGGEHVYSLRALGPTGSFVCTWAIVFGYVTVAAFEAVALPSAMAFIVPGFNAIPLWDVAGEPVYATWILVGVFGTLGITYLNYIGIRVAAQFQIIMTVIIALAGLILIGGAVTNGQPSPDSSFGAGTAGIFTVVLMTPFMFVGFDVIPQSAEEADIPARTLGLLIILAVGLAALFYMAVIWGSSRALSGSALVDSSLPAAAAMAELYDSSTAGQLMALAGVAGILTSWNAFIIGGSRALFALSESGMLPEPLSKVHPKHNTPSNAILLVGGLSALAPFFGEQMLTWIVNAGGLGIVVAWFLVVVSFLVLRYREPEMNRPYEVPGGPVVGILGFVATAIFITLYLPGGQSALLWPYEWLIVLGWCVLGLVLYAVSGDGSVETADEVVSRIEALDE